MVKKLAGDELIRVVVLVRRKQFTQQFAVDVRECSQVIGNA